MRSRPAAGTWRVLAEQAERERAAETERARQDVREERVRIARELHDVVAHALAVVTVQAGVGRRLMAKRPEEARSALESIELIGRTAQEELRVVVGLLREEGIGAAELSPTPRLADLKELAETVRASGTPVELQMAGIDRQLSPALELTVYRVVQEALTNVVKHAPSARAAVDVTISGTAVRIEVVNDGNPAGRLEEGGVMPGHGIIGMSERIGAFGGSLTAGPRPGGGFGVFAQVPFRESAMTVRVLVVDDEALLRTAFTSLIGAEEDLRVVGEAADGKQAVELAARLAPDVVLMDVRMPVLDGIEATRLITRSGTASAPRVLILTTFDLDQYVFEALRAGASGFALKSRPWTSC